MVQLSTPWVTPIREWAPREALFVKLLWPLVNLCCFGYTRTYTCTLFIYNEYCTRVQRKNKIKKHNHFNCHLSGLPTWASGPSAVSKDIFTDCWCGVWRKSYLHPLEVELVQSLVRFIQKSHRFSLHFVHSVLLGVRLGMAYRRT